jgi:predicted ATPase
MFKVRTVGVTYIAMYIHELTVRDYMIHRSTNIKLSPITALIEPNGGGKSALFDAILNFSMLSRGSIKQAFGGYPYSYSATKCRRAAGYERIGFDVVMSTTQTQTERLHYSINYSQLGIAEHGNPTFKIKTESLTLSDGAISKQLFDRADLDRYVESQKTQVA